MLYFVGPEDEQSNRVIRLFGPAFEDCFIRVAFSDEGGTLYRHDWEVDNTKFIAKRVGTILNEGGCLALAECVLTIYPLS